jgi:hypothetical protein
MRKLTIAAALVATAFIAATPATPPKPAGLDAARAAFVASLKAKNWTALADQISWPLKIENYGSPPSVAKAAYLKDHTKLTMFFGSDDPATLKCIGTAAATYQGDKTQFGFGQWNVDCDGNEFYFGAKDGKVLFTGYQNVNE